MTTLLILSDIHGHLGRLQAILARETCDYVISLGDLEIPAEHLDAFDVMIHGNAFLDPGKAFHTMTVDAYHLVFTHGHKEHVNRSDHGLYQLLRKSAGDLLFHGHTHAARITQVHAGWLINPGAISQSRSAFPESYGVLAIESHEAILTLKDISGTPLKTQRFLK